MIHILAKFIFGARLGAKSANRLITITKGMLGMWGDTNGYNYSLFVI